MGDSSAGGIGRGLGDVVGKTVRDTDISDRVKRCFEVGLGEVGTYWCCVFAPNPIEFERVRSALDVVRIAYGWLLGERSGLSLRDASGRMGNGLDFCGVDDVEAISCLVVRCQ